MRNAKPGNHLNANRPPSPEWGEGGGWFTDIYICAAMKWGGALRDDTKIGCVADYCSRRASVLLTVPNSVKCS